MVLTLRLCVVYDLRTTSTQWFCTNEMESVYCAVRTETLYKTDTFRLQRVKSMQILYNNI
jgi:hypothetical protein